jgi:hypothetical protein
MGKPHPSDLEDIQHFLASPHMGNFDKPFLGIDRDVWGSFLHPKMYAHDLVCLRDRTDAFSSWIIFRITGWLVKCGGRRWKKANPAFGDITVDNTSVLRVTFWVTSAMAVFMPVVAVVVWEFVGTRIGAASLGAMVGVNFGVAVFMGIFTQARRTEIILILAL